MDKTLLRVKVEHRDKSLRVVNETDLELIAYCEYLAQRLTGLLVLMENGMEETSDGTLAKIKHKLFDCAGEIRRLPDTMYLPEKPPATLSLIKQMFSR